MRGVYLEVNWLPVDAFVAPGDTCSLCLDLPLHLCEIIPSPPGDVMEFCPVLLRRNACRCMWNVRLIVAGLAVLVRGYIDELQDQGATSDYAASTGQKVPANNVLED